MPEALFLSVEKLKQATVINENVDNRLITPVITKVQELRIHEILGTALYQDLMDDIATDSTLSGSADYLYLLTNYVQPCMIQYCMSDGAYELHIKFMNNAVSTKSTANATPVATTDLVTMIDRYKADAEIYEKRLIAYLIQYTDTKFPLYLSPGVVNGEQLGIAYIYPKHHGTSSPIYLGDSEEESGGLPIMEGGPCFP